MLQTSLLFLCFVLLGCATGTSGHFDLDQAIKDNHLRDLCQSGHPAACALNGEKVDFKRSLPILQGETSEHQTRISVQVPARESLHYYLRHDHDPVLPLEAERMVWPDSSSAIDQLEIFNLKAKTNYELIVIGPDELPWDQRHFHTLDSHAKRAHIALVSETNPQESTGPWGELLRAKPDLILLLGDTWYGAESTANVWESAAKAWSGLELFQANPLVPTLAIWNDEDFGQKNGDATFEQKGSSKDIFLSFYAQKKPAPNFKVGPGVAALFEAFQVRFVLLDNRTFRSPRTLPTGVHFGPAQDAWMISNLKDSSTPTFLLSGDQFFGGYHAYESFEGNHASDFRAFLKTLHSLKAPIILLSGNRHFSEILKVPTEAFGYPTVEVTSGPMQAQTSTMDHSSLRIVSAHERNFLLLDLIRSSPGFVQFEVQSVGANQQQLFQKTFTVKRP